MSVETVQLLKLDTQSVALSHGDIYTVDHATDSQLCQ